MARSCCSPDRGPAGRPDLGMTLSTRILLGLGLGLVIGIALAPADAGLAATVVAWVEPVGELWVNAIRMTVIPLLVSLLVGGIVSAGSGTVARIGGRTLAWFVGLVAATATLAGLTGPTLLRWVGADRVQLPEAAAAPAASAVSIPPFSDWFVGLIPANPVAAAADGAILPLVVFTVIFALAATRAAPEHRRVIERGAQALSATILVVVEWILAVAPVGVFALTLSLGARTGLSVIWAVGGFLLVAGSLLAVATAVLFPLVRSMTGISFRLFGRACAPAQAVGFSTRSPPRSAAWSSRRPSPFSNTDPPSPGSWGRRSSPHSSGSSWGWWSGWAWSLGWGPSPSIPLGFPAAASS